MSLGVPSHPKIFLTKKKTKSYLTTNVCMDLNPSNDPVQVPLGPITQARTKRFKESLQALVCSVQDQHGVHRNIEGLEVTNRLTYTLIWANEASNHGHACS